MFNPLNYDFVDLAGLSQFRRSRRFHQLFQFSISLLTCQSRHFCRFYLCSQTFPVFPDLSILSISSISQVFDNLVIIINLDDFVKLFDFCISLWLLVDFVEIICFPQFCLSYRFRQFLSILFINILNFRRSCRFRRFRQS